MKVINGAEDWSVNLIILDVLDSVSCFENNDFNFTPRPCIVAAHWLAKMGYSNVVDMVPLGMVFVARPGLFLFQHNLLSTPKKNTLFPKK